MASRSAALVYIVRSLGRSRAVAEVQFSDGEVYLLRVASAGRALVPDAAEVPPYPGAKPHLALPPKWWADHVALCRLLRTTFEELPRPKPRKKRAAPGTSPGGER